ncbi:putative minor capsid protein [Rhizobium phage RHph_Y2_17_1]|nr:putative minor capsid protein [Rhizobium phage RHph_Y2_11]QIG75784.1 putative minor capsid protein [Rhizobium phage RHph_Y2_17_1]
MICNHLTDLAGQASVRYAMFTDGLRSIYRRALNSQVLDDTAATREAGELAVAFLRNEATALEAAIQEVAEIAHTATLEEIASNDTENLSDEALEHLSVSSAYLADELLAQASRDVATMRRSIQRVRLEVSLASRSSGRSQRAAMVEYMIGNKTDIDFFFHDKASRKWESKLFVRSIYRQTLLSVYNEIVLYTLADHGIDRAEVEHHSPDAQHDGMVIALSSSTELPTYSEIRETVFHPNANAWLKMEGSHVHA